MKWALVDSDNIVQNLIVYEEGEEYTPPDGLVIQQVNDWLNPGDAIGKTEPSPPPVAPLPITKLQFLQAATAAGYITQTEALAAGATGALPALVASAIAALPSANQFVAQLTWTAMTVVERSNPLVGVVAARLNLTAAQVDAFFIGAAAL